MIVVVDVILSTSCGIPTLEICLGVTMGSKDAGPACSVEKIFACPSCQGSPLTLVGNPGMKDMQKSFQQSKQLEEIAEM